MKARASSVAETEAAAAELATRLGPGDIVLVRGEMGAGKTTFVRGACRALGVDGPVTSPTFTIGTLYDVDGRRIAPLDLHRLASLAGEDPALSTTTSPRTRSPSSSGRRSPRASWPSGRG